MEETIIMSEEIDEEEIDVEEESSIIGVFPSGTINITTNGEHNVTNYESANVNVNVGTQMQEKSINIDANGTQVITPDSGYDGLTQVDIVTNVQPTLQNKTITPTTSETQVTPDSGYDALGEVTIEAVTNEIDENIQASNIKKDVTILGITGTMTSPKPNWAELGYTDCPSSVINNFNEAKNVYDNWDSQTTSLSYAFSINHNPIVYVPFINTENVTDMSYMCNNNPYLEYVPALNTVNVTTFQNAFNSCKSLQNSPEFNTSNATMMRSMFSGCEKLVSLYSYDTSKCTRLDYMLDGCTHLVDFPQQDWGNLTSSPYYMFDGCVNLSNESLNNVLASCITATKVSASQKTLQRIYISREQATICQTLSNWTAFVNAGWTTGY